MESSAEAKSEAKKQIQELKGAIAEALHGGDSTTAKRLRRRVKRLKRKTRTLSRRAADEAKAREAADKKAQEEQAAAQRTAQERAAREGASEEAASESSPVAAEAEGETSGGSEASESKEG